MTEYIVELYCRRTDSDAIDRDAASVREAAAVLSRDGTPVRFVRSIFVPEDETCFLLFEAVSFDAVQQAVAAAALPCDGIHETAGRSGRSPQLTHRRPPPVGHPRKAQHMTQTQQAPAVDLTVVKGRQQQAWSSGDYHVVAARIVPVAEQLCETADLHAGWSVLDVATGSGNAAIAAARLGCTVTGVDYVPSLLARARERAAADGFDIEFAEGDAEALPYADGTFDATISVFGSMFAPDHERTAAELLRVTRPGGTIALASWTPDGFLGHLFRTIGAHVPPPAGVRSPMLWGTEAHLRELFGTGISSLRVRERTYTWRFTSAQEFVDLFRTWYGPALKAFAALDEAGQAALEADLLALVSRFDRLGAADAIAFPATYLEATAVRR